MESGINKRLNILLINSFMPRGSATMVEDMYKSLSEKHNVDLLLKYPIKSTMSVLSVYSRFEYFFLRVSRFFLGKFFRLKNLLFRVNKSIQLPQYHFFGINDANPPVSSKKVLKKIQKDYDLIIVFFWQDMITSKTLYDIYQKTKKPILLISADMFPMTGGCSYFWDCDRLEKSCGKCPGINSSDENDITRKNFLYKKNKLENINCVFLGNTWMNKYAAKSGLFKKIDIIYPIIDENVFKPRDKEYLKKQKNYTGKIILFFGAVNANEERKGYRYLVEALQLLSEKRPELVGKIVLLVAGNNADLPELSGFSVEKTGYLTFDQLAECYAVSDIFLSPSIQDAGPMMLNQSLLCGTPAVAFDMGTAFDILNSQTGYLAKFRDSEDFCNGVISLINKSEEELAFMSKECRIQSLKKYSYKVFRDGIVRIYNEVK
ncbi:glycosyltransferase [Flavobacterium yafengii]|uniref:glycosyltransferase n=1 Tax=Flavobacterium yafengii TaxID=3041253 RepID=UPI0024A8DB1A|nr:glycosyltransferase [Flavobacterium yafengii]